MQPIRNILCPVDFSETSEFGLDYAAHLAKALNASIRLVYVRTSIWPEAVQLEHDNVESSADISDRLSAYCEETRHAFGVHCAARLVPSSATLGETLAAEAHESDMIVMGTGGAGTYFRMLFGTDSFHVIQNARRPVLLVPAGCPFTDIGTMAYAHDPDANPIFQIDDLIRLAAGVQSAIKVVHVCREPRSPQMEHRCDILRGAVMARKPRNVEWSFEFIYSDNVARALDGLMARQEADVLALSFHRRPPVERFLTENVVKEIAAVAHYPVLIFWH